MELKLKDLEKLIDGLHLNIDNFNQMDYNEENELKFENIKESSKVIEERIEDIEDELDELVEGMDIKIFASKLNESKNEFCLLKMKFNQKSEIFLRLHKFSKLTAEIHSQINEIYGKTIITQKIKNESKFPKELMIYVYKNNKNIFSSFTAKIGDSIEVKSKIIKTEKAEEKYTDSISSGNAAIYASIDPKDKNKLIINMGNIPPKEELVFTSEFLQFIESSDTYEFELFRNLPLFVENKAECLTPNIKGIVEIKTKNKINKIDKEFLSDHINIIEEKYIGDNKCEYLLKYEYKNLPEINLNTKTDYIPSSKIYFWNEMIGPRIIYQKSLIQNEINCIFTQKMIQSENNLENEDIINPGLFIFLIDQSGSMSGYPMNVASKTLILFLQSLPPKSYYQIIGFGSNYIKYDDTPKEYKQGNIKKSIKLIEQLKANLGGTDIYSPLKDIYDSKKIYQKIKLPKNIFLLTDGEINNKKETLKIIEQNCNEFFIYSIGIGNYFDEDLIKNAGILGKGNYNFCKNIEGLNEIIVDEIKNSSSPFISDFQMETDFKKDSIYKINNETSIIKFNKPIIEKYILNNNSEIFGNENNKLNLEIKYMINNGKIKNKNICEKYEITPEKIPEGEEISKLIMNDYLNKNKVLNEEEKIKLSLKYQVLTENTSLFAKINLSEKITEEMKTEIFGEKKKDSRDYIFDNPSQDDILNSISNNILAANNTLKNIALELKYQGASLDKVGCECPIENINKTETKNETKKEETSISKFFGSVGNSIKGLFSKKKKSENNIKINNNNDLNDKIEDKELKNEINEDINKEMKEDINNLSNDKKYKNKNIDIREIINTQNFVEGYWDINKDTKKIKEKYEKEYNLLKGLKNLTMNDKIAMTILIILYINKEHQELLKELSLIILKAKIYIKNNAKDSYENIIKEINI